MATDVIPTQQIHFYGHFQQTPIVLTGLPHDWRVGEVRGGMTEEQKTVLGRILALAEHYGASIVFSPDTRRSTTRLLKKDEFVEDLRIRPTSSVCLYRTPGVFGDVVEIRKGYAAWILSDDCPTLAVLDRDSGGMFVANAGRDCLIDRHLIDTGTSTRTHSSVVDTVMTSLASSSSENLSAAILLGIAPTNFPHSFKDDTWGERNERLIEHIEGAKWFSPACLPGEREKGQINLPAIIFQQLRSYGVPAKNIVFDGRDTYSERDGSGDLRWHSNRRDGKKAGRNGVLIVNR